MPRINHHPTDHGHDLCHELDNCCLENTFARGAKLSVCLHASRCAATAAGAVCRQPGVAVPCVKHRLLEAWALRSQRVTFLTGSSAWVYAGVCVFVLVCIWVCPEHKQKRYQGCSLLLALRS